MQGNPTYRLVMRRGPQPNQVFELTGEVTNLGRDITNDIVINDREVSRHHLRFLRGSEGYTVEDLGSTNGTFINGKRVTGASPLKNGDMIGLGETVTLQFEVVRPGQQAQPAQQHPQPQQQTAPSRPEQPQPQPAQEEEVQPQRQPEAPPQPYQAQPQYQPDYQAAAQPEGEYAPQQDYYASQYSPPPPGYDYDPYAMREEEGGNTARWIMLGCLGLLLFCCCITVIGVVIVDSFNLYQDIPLLCDVLGAFGLYC